MDKELAISEISNFFSFAGINAVVYSPSFNEPMEQIAVGHPSLRLLIPLKAPDTDAAPGLNRLSFDDILALGQECGREFEPDTDRERVTELLFSSGTTGRA